MSALQIRGVLAITEEVEAVLEVVMWMEDEVVMLLEELLVDVDVLFGDELVEAFDVEVDDLIELLLPVPDWELFVEVEVTLEDEDESGDSETQSTWPIDKSQLVSREGL